MLNKFLTMFSASFSASNSNCSSLASWSIFNRCSLCFRFAILSFLYLSSRLVSKCFSPRIFRRLGSLPHRLNRRRRTKFRYRSHHRKSNPRRRSSRQLRWPSGARDGSRHDVLEISGVLHVLHTAGRVRFALLVGDHFQIILSQYVRICSFAFQKRFSARHVQFLMSFSVRLNARA